MEKTKQIKDVVGNYMDVLKTKTTCNEYGADLVEVEREIRNEAIVLSKIGELPKRYRHVKFSDYQLMGTPDQQMSQIELIKLLKENKPVLMYGNNGTGKTMLAIASLRDKIEKGMSPKYITLHELMSEIKESFNSPVPTSRIVEKYINYDYLVIDEIDKTYRSETEFHYLFSIINGRYNIEKPTVLISNAGASDVIDVVGRSIFERIVEDGIAINMNWDSYRKFSKIQRQSERTA